MRRITYVVFFLLLGISLTASAAKQNIRVEINETASLTGMVGYAFATDKEPENLPSAPRRREYFRAARAAITNEMQKKGYRLVDKEQAEFLVEFSGMGILVQRVATSQDTRRISINPVQGAGEAGTNVDGTQGIIRVLISLPSEPKHIWAATGTLEVGSGPKQTLRRINKLVRQVLKEFPATTVK